MPTQPELPSFRRPPLSEVALGVQFLPIPSYTLVDAQPVWQMYRNDFPEIAEQPPLPPQFETFGGGAQFSGVQFQFGPAIQSNRLWFVSRDGSHLLQFQPDRFLANWRKNGDDKYPRFEHISEKFGDNLRKLVTFVDSEKNAELDINQAEISYINIIPIDRFDEYHKWISFLNSMDFTTERLNLNLSEVVNGHDGHPIARLHHDLQTVVTLDGKNKALQLSLTYRGRPSDSKVQSVIEFLAQGRLAIINRFVELTTDEAHIEWGREQ
jgi:uncharacterized protein (TIGR04255 family)